MKKSPARSSTVSAVLGLLKKRRVILRTEDDRILKVSVRQKLKKINAGAKITVYAATNMPVYEKDCVHLLNSYLLDVFGLKENYLEADLEKAILADIEAFILEFGHGFSFVERQKRRRQIYAAQSYIRHYTPYSGCLECAGFCSGITRTWFGF